MFFRNLLAVPVVVCEENVDSRDTLWEETLEGETRELLCDTGFTGKTCFGKKKSFCYLSDMQAKVFVVPYKYHVSSLIKLQRKQHCKPWEGNQVHVIPL